MRCGTNHSCIFFWWNVDFTSHQKIGLSSIGRVYLIYGILEMPRLAYMVTKQMMCLKQTQSLLYFATVQRWKSLEHWINIQVSNIVVKWYASSHEKGFWNSLKQSLRGVHWQRCSWKFCKIYRETPAPEATCLKKDSGTCAFCEFCDIFMNTFFYWTPLDNCFWIAYSEGFLKLWSKYARNIKGSLFYLVV